MKLKKLGSPDGEKPAPPTPKNEKPGRTLVVLIKILISVPLIAFSLWLLKLVYFPEAHLVPHAAPIVEEDGIFRQILKTGKPKDEDHYHMLDAHVGGQTEPYRPICATCHGSYPHSKEKRVRSLLNFHTGYMACAVCHVRKSAEDKDLFFVWVNRYNGTISSQVDGSFGKYPAKIFPMVVTAAGDRQIFRPVTEKAAEEFIELKTRFSPDQMAVAKTKLHERLSKKPVFCTECHKKGGYFDFAKLGFPRNRVDNLTSNEIARMLENYETFYIPEAIDFGAR
jgi:hypothetical protein